MKSFYIMCLKSLPIELEDFLSLRHKHKKYRAVPIIPSNKNRKPVLCRNAPFRARQ